MQGNGKIIGYAISDPEGRYPQTPEFGVGCLAEARTEARDINHDFADELYGKSYGVMALFDGGGAECVS